MRYFAYGSNMLTTRLTARCPAARPLMRAELAGHTVRYDKLGQDGSAKATLIPAAEEVTHGILYDFAADEIPVLDRIEGVGIGYQRLDSVVTRDETGVEIEAFTYIADAPEGGLLPFDWYVALVVAGCRQHTLPAPVEDWHRQQPHHPDTKEHSPGRAAALSALHESNARDWVAEILG